MRLTLMNRYRTCHSPFLGRLVKRKGTYTGSLEKVHFHEVGAVDSIIDIIGAAILINQLGIESVQSSAIPTGSGHIHIDHGIYPVPAPATLEILKGVPIAANDIRSELTTPTGAAISAVLAETFGSLPSHDCRIDWLWSGNKNI